MKFQYSDEEVVVVEFTYSSSCSTKQHREAMHARTDWLALLLASTLSISRDGVKDEGDTTKGAEESINPKSRKVSAELIRMMS